jgi:uncharacterized membrane protein YhaH (DUF805 family)
MDMVTAVKTVLGKYATFSGRAARPEYWWWVLATIILFVVLGLVDGAVLAPMQGLEAFDPTAGQPISLIASLGLLVPNLAVAARRLHDTDKSGWWLLLGLIPLIGNLVLIFLLVQKGTEGANRFG